MTPRVRLHIDVSVQEDECVSGHNDGRMVIVLDRAAQRTAHGGGYVVKSRWAHGYTSWRTEGKYRQTSRWAWIMLRSPWRQSNEPQRWRAGVPAPDKLTDDGGVTATKAPRRTA